ncbi:hypothetical protein Hanom_Chr02g00098441 [Helianthus anomalus]
MCYFNVMILRPSQSPYEGDQTLIAFSVLEFIFFFVFAPNDCSYMLNSNS